MPSATAPRPSAGYVLIVASAVLFAMNGTVSKLVLGTGLPAQRLTELRSAGALVALVLICLVRRTSLRVRWQDLPLLAFYGVVGFAMVQWLYLLAIGQLPVGIGLLFEFTAPVLVAVWARLVQRRPVRRRLWAALVLSLSGLTMVAEVWGDARLDPEGVAAGLLCAVALAVFFLIGEHRVATHDPNAVTCWGFVFATLFWTVVQPWWGYPVEFLSEAVTVGEFGWKVPAWSLMLWIILLGTVAPFLLGMHSLRHLPATTVGVVGMLEPVLAGVVAWLALGERVGTWQLLGGVVVLVGIAMAQTARLATPAAAPAVGAGEALGSEIPVGGHSEADSETDVPPIPTT